VPVVHHVTSFNLPELQPYRTLRRPKEHLDKRIFVAEGEKVVRRILASKLPVVSLLVSNEWLTRLSSEIQSLPPDVFVADMGLLETIVGFRMHQGIMAVGQVPPEPILEDLIQLSPPPKLFAAVDGLVFAENVGAIVRNCAAFGVQGIVVGATSASPYLRRAVRNSMGTVFQIPVIHTAALLDTLMTLRFRHKISIIIADAHTHTSLYEVNYRNDICFVFGNEENGVSEAVRSAETHSIGIPMKEGVDSLNVASASAVILSEVARQRMT